MTNGTESAAGSLPPDALVVVIGAGVIGASVAFHLAEAGVREVLVLDRDRPAGGSSGKPIGGVRAQFSDPLNIRLGQRSLAAFRDFPQRPGVDVGLDGPTLYFHNDGAGGLLLGMSDPRQPPGFDRSFTLGWLPLFRAAAALRAPSTSRPQDDSTEEAYRDRPAPDAARHRLPARAGRTAVEPLRRAAAHRRRQR
ncbi:FAD-binding oxidoreductase [Streptomyces sp. RB6PN23]|uniref:FAD-binding oxidoreductase n=1 Tax=Streptomyces silvisoli TaxID=3034235 RepID=A0ABT5ZDY1_9ACTN|nr:FAD-binding oxidoreductase [Streptomyces silvisoli]MDF3287815.1 FAD-binding oxidoreductase [Streptomyces silvisoli]